MSVPRQTQRCEGCGCAQGRHLPGCVFYDGLSHLREAYAEGLITDLDELELRLDYALEGDVQGALGGLPKPLPPRDPSNRSTR